jgi:hypothetical protein
MVASDVVGDGVGRQGGWDRVRRKPIVDFPLRPIKESSMRARTPEAVPNAYAIGSGSARWVRGVSGSPSIEIRVVGARSDRVLRACCGGEELGRLAGPRLSVHHE